MKNVLIASAVALAFTAAPYAQQPGGMKSPDEKFVIDAAHAGMAEVELGKLATEKASKEEVKTFAQRMVDDHSKSAEALKAIAQPKNIAWPTDLDAKHKAVRDRLSKLSGEGFDRAYMQEMVEGHRKVVAMVRTESTTGKDPEVKAWAAKTLPTTQDHFKQAQDIARGVVGTSGTAKPKP
jgi:putative membrane protein